MNSALADHVKHGRIIEGERPETHGRAPDELERLLLVGAA